MVSCFSYAIFRKVGRSYAGKGGIFYKKISKNLDRRGISDYS